MASKRAASRRTPLFIDPPGYARHRPDETLLDRLVAQHYPEFVAARLGSGPAATAARAGGVRGVSEMRPRGALGDVRLLSRKSVEMLGAVHVPDTSSSIRRSSSSAC